jgi:hypothetical protein
MCELLLVALLVHGRVTLAGDGIPGVVVTLSGATTVTDERGRYSFTGVPVGLRIVKAELAEVGSVETVIEVKEGANRVASITLPWGDPPLAIACASAEPESEWDAQSCIDYNLDTALMDAGDPSAIALLAHRWKHALAWSQRLRIAPAILGRIPDDRAVWNEVSQHAEVAVRVMGQSREAFEDYCDEHDLPTSSYEEVVWSALSAALRDPRARPLLERALKSKDAMLVAAAEDALAQLGN